MSSLSIKNLNIKSKESHFLKNINITVNKGEILGIVGESGSGKTMITRAIFDLLSKDLEIVSGEIYIYHTNILSLDNKERRKMFGRDLSLIPQNPFSSLNPIITIGKQMEEAISIHYKKTKSEYKDEVIQALEEVGLGENVYNMYPYELSGGMVQRVLIAISIINNPDILIADEPTTALDVIVQSEILNLLKNIVAKRNISLIFISHDLDVIDFMCHNVFVIYNGFLMEFGKTTEIIKNPYNPYTISLLDSIPKDRYINKKINTDKGYTENYFVEGCSYYARCLKRKDECRNNINIVNIDNRQVRCLLFGE